MLPYYTQKRKCLSCDSALMAPAELYNCFFMQCFWIFFFLCVNLREAESLKNRKIYYYVCRLYCFRVRIQRRQAPHQCGVGPGSIYIFSPIFCLIFENLKHKILLFFYNFSFFFFFRCCWKNRGLKPVCPIRALLCCCCWFANAQLPRDWRPSLIFA